MGTDIQLSPTLRQQWRKSDDKTKPSEHLLHCVGSLDFASIQPLISLVATLSKHAVPSTFTINFPRSQLNAGFIVGTCLVSSSTSLANKVKVALWPCFILVTVGDKLGWGNQTSALSDGVVVNSGHCVAIVANLAWILWTTVLISSAICKVFSETVQASVGCYSINNSQILSRGIRTTITTVYSI